MYNRDWIRESRSESDHLPALLFRRIMYSLFHEGGLLCYFAMPYTCTSFRLTENEYSLDGLETMNGREKAVEGEC